MFGKNRSAGSARVGVFEYISHLYWMYTNAVARSRPAADTSATPAVAPAPSPRPKTGPAAAVSARKTTPAKGLDFGATNVIADPDATNIIPADLLDRTARID